MFQTMESISVLVANTYGIMVPINGSYHDLINLSSLELDINNDIDELEKNYDVGGNMAPVRIMNYWLLQFYLLIKRNEATLMAYTYALLSSNQWDQLDLTHIHSMKPITDLFVQWLMEHVYV